MAISTYAVVENGVVTNVVLSDSALAPNWYLADNVDIGWVLNSDGSFSPPEKTPEESQAELVAGTQNRLDSFARTRSYDDIISACTYENSTVPQFAAEGQYCVQARDETWIALYEILDEVAAGTRPMPASFEEIEPELPPLVWPE